MATRSPAPGAVARESAFWRAILQLFLKGVPTPVMRTVRARNPAAPIEEFEIVGRSSGRRRRMLLTLLDVDGTWYVGSPNGTSQWIRNLEAAGERTVTRRDGISVRVTAVEVTDPSERNAVLEATGRQPPPAGAVYRAAGAHIRAVGRYFRLERADDTPPAGPS